MKEKTIYVVVLNYEVDNMFESDVISVCDNFAAAYEALTNKKNEILSKGAYEALTNTTNNIPQKGSWEADLYEGNVDFEEVEEFGYYNSFEEAKNKMDDILNKNPQDYISE